MLEGENIDRNTVATVGLSFVDGVGPKMFEMLVGRFGNPEGVLAMPADELCEIPRLTPKIAEAIHATDLEEIEAELMALEEFGITVITRDDKSYPQNLKIISNAPPVLFQTGAFREEDNHAVAIVGTRKPSQHGQEVARDLAYGLAELGFTIVSGLALGIDAAAHQGALGAEGRTIAVLGSGIKVIHPRQNRELAEQISQSGAIFSELHPNARPARGTLMSRDRITSGLALGTIVVESNEDSGSIDTAKRTRQQGRKLFAVANESEGNRKLLDEGAYPIADVTQESLGKIAAILTTAEIEELSNDSQMSLF